MFGWLKKEKSEGGAATASPEARPKTQHTPVLKVKMLERKGCSASLSVTVPAEEVDLAVEEAFSEIRKQVKMPGFRAGKVPMETVKKNFRGHALEHAINNLIRETAAQALEQENLAPLATPSVDKVEHHDGKPLKYELKVECAPEVPLKNYKGLPLAIKKRPVQDADVQQRLEALRENNAKLAPSTDETVTEKHFALVDYDASLDGAPVAGGQAKDQLVEVAAPQSLAGFNDALRGMKKGETKDAGVPFPADHPNKQLAGKTVTFKITVKDIKEKQLPTADDEFAKDLGLASLAELKDRLKKNLEAERTREERQDIEKQVIDALLERHPFEVPPSLVEQRALELTERLKGFLASQGASPKDWDANAPKMVERNRPEAEKQVRLSYLLVEIAKKEDIEAGDADVDAAIEKSVQEAAPGKAEEMRKWFAERRENLRAQLKEEKIFNFLIDNAQKTEQTAS